MISALAAGYARTCQACKLGYHEQCTRSTTLGTGQGQYRIDCCGCTCPQASVHREAAEKWAAAKSEAKK